MASVNELLNRSNEAVNPTKKRIRGDIIATIRRNLREKDKVGKKYVITWNTRLGMTGINSKLTHGEIIDEFDVSEKIKRLR